jgi:hypothetical protein
MKCEAKRIEFGTEESGGFSISIDFAMYDPVAGQATVTVSSNELEGLDFMQAVSVFRAKLNERFST